jgi:hypothetical protein
MGEPSYEQRTGENMRRDCVCAQSRRRKTQQAIGDDRNVQEQEKSLVSDPVMRRLAISSIQELT